MAEYRAVQFYEKDVKYVEKQLTVAADNIKGAAMTTNVNIFANNQSHISTSASSSAITWGPASNCTTTDYTDCNDNDSMYNSSSYGSRNTTTNINTSHILIRTTGNMTTTTTTIEDAKEMFSGRYQTGKIDPLKLSQLCNSNNNNNNNNSNNNSINYSNSRNIIYYFVPATEKGDYVLRGPTAAEVVDDPMWANYKLNLLTNNQQQQRQPKNQQLGVVDNNVNVDESLESTLHKLQSEVYI